MATIYKYKVNMSELSEQIRDDINYLKDITDKLYFSINDNVIVYDEKDINVKYKLIDLEKNHDRRIISGRLIKIFEESDISKYDEMENTVESTKMKNQAHCVAFSFKVDTEIIAYIPKRNLSRNEFNKYFSKILTESLSEIGIVNLQPIVDRGTLRQRLNEMEVATEFSFVIVKPNGIGDDEIKELSNDLIETGSEKAEIKFKGNRKNPLKKNAQIIKKFVSFIESGWGQFKAIGYKQDNSPMTIDTSKDTIQKMYVAESNKDSHMHIQERVFPK